VIGDEICKKKVLEYILNVSVHCGNNNNRVVPFDVFNSYIEEIENEKLNRNGRQYKGAHVNIEAGLVQAKRRVV